MDQKAMIFNLKPFSFNRNPSKIKQKSTNLTKSEINQGIIHLQLSGNVSIRSYENGEDLKELILCYSKAIGDYSMKHEQASNALFCEKDIEKSNSKIGKDGQGLLNLWKDILQSLPSVANDHAQAIISKYPSPLLLKKTYDSMPQHTASLLLAEIQVKLL
jgi:hypothetical protein